MRMCFAETLMLLPTFAYQFMGMDKHLQLLALCEFNAVFWLYLLRLQRVRGVGVLGCSLNFVFLAEKKLSVGLQAVKGLIK